MLNREQVVRHCASRMREMVRQQLAGFARLRAFEGSDDVAQNATIRLLRALDDVGPATELDLLRLSATMIRRELIDLHRRYFGPEGPGGKVMSGGKSDAPEPPDPRGSEDDAALRRLAVHDAVDGLPAELRAVVDLLFYQGLSQDEAAAALSVGPATLRRRWRDARERLGKHFDA